MLETENCGVNCDNRDEIIAVAATGDRSAQCKGQDGCCETKNTKYEIQKRTVQRAGRLL